MSLCCTSICLGIIFYYILLLSFVVSVVILLVKNLYIYRLMDPVLSMTPAHLPCSVTLTSATCDTHLKLICVWYLLCCIDIPCLCCSYYRYNIDTGYSLHWYRIFAYAPTPHCHQQMFGLHLWAVNLMVPLHMGLTHLVSSGSLG